MTVNASSTGRLQGSGTNEMGVTICGHGLSEAFVLKAGHHVGDEATEVISEACEDEQCPVDANLWQ